jgi:hypothetical protein
MVSRAPVDHRFVSMLLQAIQQPLHVPNAQPQFFGSFALRNQPLLRLLQRHQPVSIGLRHQ